LQNIKAHFANYNLYNQTHIPTDNYFEWLAIMQHYGSPTRLLDFTESIFIATYFAVVESDSDPAICAINRYKLRDNLLKKQELSNNITTVPELQALFRPFSY
jgi:hypothetical protein